MNLRERFRKRKALKQAKQQYFKRKDKSFFFITSWGGNHPRFTRGLKITACCVVPISLVIIGTIWGVNYVKTNNNEDYSTIVKPAEDKVTRRVYLLSEENDTVPLSVKLDKMNSIHEEILEVFNLLKEDSVITSSHFKGVIPSSSRVVSFTLDDGLLSLNLSEEFLEYNVPQEKLFSSITYTMLQFEQVQKVSLQVEDLLSSGIMDANNGINLVSNYNVSSTLGKELITYYYNKTIGDTSYYVPRSIYVETQEKANLTFYKGLSIRLPASSGYRSIDLYKRLASNQTPSDSMTFAVKNDALVEENLVDNDLYNLLLLSMDIMKISSPVSFTLEGESVPVEGVIEEENYQVSSIIYNEVQI